MKKVLQTKVCKNEGNCCRAVIASLFDKEIDEVPEFFPDETQGLEIMRFFMSQGYDPSYYDRKEDDKKYPSIEEVAKFDGGVNGYFYASVKSQTFDDTSHAVVVDSDLNIVHDPNPNQLALKLKPEDVKQILTVGKWYFDSNGNFVEE